MKSRRKLEAKSSPIKLPEAPGHSLIASTVTCGGEVLNLFVESHAARPYRSLMAEAGFATASATEEPGPFVITKPEYAAVLVITNTWGSREIELPHLTTKFPAIEMLPSGEILIVSSRCQRYEDESYDLNARVYTTKGELGREFLLGDGIEDLQVDRLGRIWVSYFDEGVFGNCGWQTPIGATGLCCFDGFGHRLWEYMPPAGFGSIADCYAMNVSREGVWAYYYTEFPIVQIGSDWRVRGWGTETAGAKAFAVHGKNVLLFGGYAENRAKCQLLELTDRGAETIADVSLEIPKNIDLRKDVVIGRDADLHVFLGSDWYRYSLESLK